MTRNQLHTLTMWSLATLTIFIVIASINQVSTGILAERMLELGVYTLLTAFALTLSVPLSKGELSIAHAIGIMAFLSLDTSVVPAMTIATFTGGILGSIVLMQFSNHPAGKERAPATFTTLIYMTSRVTLSFFVASRIYLDAFQTTLPISSSADFEANFIALIAYALAYIMIYFASFVLETETDVDGTPLVLQENFSALASILVMPVPFAFIGASVARTDDSIIFFTITVIGTVLIIFGLYILNRAQDQMRRQLDEMRSISVAAQALRGNLDLDGLLRTTYVQVSQMINADSFTVALCAEDTHQIDFPLVIRQNEQVFAEEEQKQIPNDYGLIERVIQMGEPLLLQEDVNGFANAQKIKLMHKAPTSWLGVPLIIGDQAIGAFAVQSYERRVFDEDDLRLLNIIVASTSIAIENARLYHQKSMRAEQLATLNQVSALLTETLSPNDVLDTVVSSASTVSDATGVAVFLFAEDKNSQLTLVRSAGLDTPFMEHPALPIIGKGMLQNSEKPQSLVISNVKEAGETLQLIRQRLIEAHVQALIENPLSLGGVNLGVLVLYYNRPQVFHDEQIDLIEAFATQAAQAISNARRFASTDRALEQRVEQLYALATMGRMLNATMDVARIYEVILTYATDTTNARRGAVILKDPHGKLSVLAQRGYPADTFHNPDILQQGLTGRVLATGQAFRTGDTRMETGYLPLIPQTRSILITPIMKGRDILGMILLENDRPATFSEGDSHFISQMVNQAIIAADNTLLFQRIREARDNMQVILDAMEEGIILINHEGEIVLANPRVDLIELSAEDILHESVETLMADKTLAFAVRMGFATRDGLRKLINQLDNPDSWIPYPPHSYELHSQMFGIRYVQRQIIPVRDEDQTLIGMLLVFYNKTEEHELERARESFSQMIVHDLRSPLTAVTTSLRLLSDVVPEDSKFRPLVEKTTSASRRALRKVLSRVDSLLDIAKMESGKMDLDREPTSLNYLAENVAAILKPLADELDIQIIQQTDENLPLLNVDGDKIERMLLNLADNALKYSPSNANILIRGKVIDHDFMRIDVEDSGPGIPDEYKQRLFDQFIQVEGRRTVRRGVGLGLTFCKLVVDAHGGKIWIEDNPTGGSIFRVTLPVIYLQAPTE